MVRVQPPIRLVFLGECRPNRHKTCCCALGHVRARVVRRQDDDPPGRLRVAPGRPGVGERVVGVRGEDVGRGEPAGELVDVARRNTGFAVDRSPRSTRRCTWG